MPRVPALVAIWEGALRRVEEGDRGEADEEHDADVGLDQPGAKVVHLEHVERGAAAAALEERREDRRDQEEVEEQRGDGRGEGAAHRHTSASYELDWYRLLKDGSLEDDVEDDVDPIFYMKKRTA